MIYSVIGVIWEEGQLTVFEPSIKVENRGVHGSPHIMGLREFAIQKIRVADMHRH